jgi:hypothetical protein
MYPYIVILLLIIALAWVGAYAWAWRCERAAAKFELSQAKESAAIAKENEEMEEARADGLLNHKLRLEAQLEGARAAVAASEAALAEAQRPRAARIKLEDAMDPEKIAQTLAGTHGTGAVKAILAHLSAKLVEKSDLSTERPREQVREPDRIIEGFSAEQRTHAAGEASGIAEVLGELQELTAAHETPTKEAA